MWLDNGNANDRAKAVAAFLTKVDADGLNPADYPVPDVKPGADVAALAEAELKLTETVLTYARHVQAGRFSYANVSKNIELPQQTPEELIDRIDSIDSLDPRNGVWVRDALDRSVKLRMSGGEIDVLEVVAVGSRQ